MRVSQVASLGSALVFMLAACSGAATPAPTAGPAAGGNVTIVKAPGSTPVKVRFRFDWIETPGDTPMQVAIAKGFFKDANLDVTTTVGTGSTDSVTLTGSGQFDIAQASSLAVVVGVGSGVPVKSIGVLYQTDPNGMISRPDSPIKVPTDLYGKKYGIQQGSSLLYYTAVVAVNKLDRTKITEVPTGFDVAPLIAKQIDGLIDFADGEVVLTRQALKAEPVFVKVKDWGVTTYGTTLIASNSFAAANGDAVKAFVAAYARGLKYSLENPAEAVTIMQKVYADADPALLKEKVMAALPYFVNSDTDGKGLLYQSTDVWQKEMDLSLQIQMIKSAVTVQQSVDSGFLPSPAIMGKLAN
jgi:NitT/TauT family transport system substrate-binding protein